MNTFECEHRTVTPLEQVKVSGIESPVTCDDCGDIVECEHEYELSGFRRIVCTICDDVKEDL